MIWTCFSCHWLNKISFKSYDKMCQVGLVNFFIIVFGFSFSNEYLKKKNLKNENCLDGATFEEKFYM
jgi:hypothetical protein